MGLRDDVRRLSTIEAYRGYSTSCSARVVCGLSGTLLDVPVETARQIRHDTSALAVLVAIQDDRRFNRRNLEEQLDINIGVLAAVPNGVKGTRDQADIIAEIESRGFEVPVVIGDRTSLLEGCWRAQCSAYRYVREHRSRRRDYELETLAQLDELARFLESQGGIEAPNPPEPGDVDHDVEVAR